MASDTKPNTFNVKPYSTPGGSSKVKVDVSAAKKKSENLNRQPMAESKIKIELSATKHEVKSKTSSTSSKATVKSVRVREKKVYSLPGQKYDTPEEREPLRIFYESLSKQIPTSEMAEFWLMEHGMLSPERAKRAYEKKQKKQKQLRTGTPIKSPLPSSKAGSLQRQEASRNGETKHKRKIVNESDEDDFILSSKRSKG